MIDFCERAIYTRALTLPLDSSGSLVFFASDTSQTQWSLSPLSSSLSPPPSVLSLSPSLSPKMSRHAREHPAPLVPTMVFTTHGGPTMVRRLLTPTEQGVNLGTVDLSIC